MEQPKKPDGPKPKRKINVTPAKHAANVANGRLSHGATSPEGRKRCSMNALKDGFYSESDVIPGESIEEFQYERDLWCRRHGAIDGPEAFFAVSSFKAAWRYARGERALNARTQEDIQSARAAHEPDPEIERIEAERIAEKIHQEPRETLISLMNFPAGCDLLASRFEALLKATRDDDCLFPSQNARLGALLGKRPQDVLEDDLLYETNRWYLSMMRPAELGLKIDNVMGIYADTMPEHSKGYRGDEVKCRINHVLTNELTSSGAEAAALQRQFITARISTLRERAARLRRERAARAERAAAAAPLSGSVESARRDRHLAMNYRRAEVGSELARKLRKARLADEDQASNEETSGSDVPAVERGSMPAEAMTPQPPRGARAENVESREEINPVPLNSPPAPLSAQPPVSGEPACPGSPPPGPDPGRPGPGPARPAERGPGPGGGVLPLVLLLVLRLLGGPARDTLPAPHHDRVTLLQAAAQSQGAWGRSPQGKTPDVPPPRPAAAGASPATGRLIPSHPGRTASLRHRPGRRVRRASLGAWGRSPQGKTPAPRPSRPAAAGASPASGRLIPSHTGQRASLRNRHGHRARPASQPADSSLILSELPERPQT
jgi:hypothetical protein